jgi:L-aspartate oxidase
VFAARIAEDLKSMNASPRVLALPSRLGLDLTPAEPSDEASVRRLRQAMSAGVGVMRDKASLAAALGEIAAVEAAARSRQLTNMAVAARLVAAAALAREESRGGHYRADFPEPRDEWRQRTLTRLADANRIAAGAVRAEARVS